MQTAVVVTFPVSSVVIDGANMMKEIFFVEKFYAKIVDIETKIDWTCFVFPKNSGSNNRIVSVWYQGIFVETQKDNYATILKEETNHG